MKFLNLRNVVPVVAVLASVAASNEAFSQIVYSDDFDVDHTANWNVNLGSGGGANNAANIFFDYNTIGIPSAPNSTGGSTRGVKLEANFGAAGAATGVSISPIGGNFTGNYMVTFDMWINYNGPLNVGGSGSTLMTGGGIGTTGTTSINHATPSGAVWFAATGDGGNGDSPGDYRAYVGGAVLAPSTGAYYAGTGTGARNDTMTYYNPLGSKTAPAAQIGLFAQQSDTTRPGAAGMAWHTVTITKNGNFLKYSIDSLDIANVDISAVTFAGNNILLVHSDINTTISSDPNRRDLAFGLIDNVTVTLIPEPATVAVALLGGLGLFLLRWRRN
jgi:hypothetical protein